MGEGTWQTHRQIMDAIQRVRELHQPVEKHSGDFKGKREYCCECYDPYPCGTIEALDGEQ